MSIFKIFDEYQLEYILLAYGENENAYMIGKLAAFQIHNLLIAYKERFDQDNFIKNLLLDNLLLVDIYNRAKKLHIDTDARRVVFIIEMAYEKDANMIEHVRVSIGRKTKISSQLSMKKYYCRKGTGSEEGYQEMEQAANAMLELLKAEGEEGLHVAYGTIVSDIKEVSKSYKEAKLALDVGKIFFNEKDVIAYSTLGIGRLIYQLPIPLCKMFIREIFEGNHRMILTRRL